MVVGLHDCNIQSVVAQPPAIATQMRLEGVTHVLIVSNFVAGQTFVTVMASQNHRPKYSTSDWFLNTSDSTQANFNPDQFDGAIGIASLGSMLRNSGKAPYPGWETCSKIATDAGLPAIGPGDNAVHRAAEPLRQLPAVPRRPRRGGPEPDPRVVAAGRRRPRGAPERRVRAEPVQTGQAHRVGPRAHRPMAAWLPVLEVHLGLPTGRPG